MPINPGFGAHGEFGHGEHADDVTGFASIGGSDTLSMLAADGSASILARLARLDALAVSLGDAANVLAELLRGEAVTLTLTEARDIAAALARADDLTVLLSDVRAIVAQVAVNDTLSPALGDQSDILARLLRDDSLSLTLAEERAIFSALARSDELATALGEAATLFADLATRTDALTIASVEQSALVVAFQDADTAAVAINDLVLGPVVALLLRDDVLSAALGEQRSIFATLSRDETLSAALAEATEIFTDLTARTDSLVVAIADQSLVVAAAAGGDTVALQIDAAVLLPIVVRLLRQDILRPALERLASGPGFGAHGEFAHGEHDLDLHGDPVVREVVEIFATLARSDALTTQVAGAAEILAALTRLDSLAAQLNESPARAEERLHRRIINVIQY